MIGLPLEVAQLQTFLAFEDDDDADSDSTDSTDDVDECASGVALSQDGGGGGDGDDNDASDTTSERESDASSGMLAFVEGGESYFRSVPLDWEMSDGSLSSHEFFLPAAETSHASSSSSSSSDADNSDSDAWSVECVWGQ